MIRTFIYLLLGKLWSCYINHHLCIQLDVTMQISHNVLINNCDVLEKPGLYGKVCGLPKEHRKSSFCVIWQNDVYHRPTALTNPVIPTICSWPIHDSLKIEAHWLTLCVCKSAVVRELTKESANLPSRRTVVISYSIVHEFNDIWLISAQS